MRRRDFFGILAGSVTLWPMAASGEQPVKAMPTVGVLWHAGSEQEEAIFLSALREGLHDLGYSEGRNIKLVNTYAAEQYDRFAMNARELVARNVDVIVAVTRPAALAAQQATRAIPVVAVVVPDLVCLRSHALRLQCRRDVALGSGKMKSSRELRDITGGGDFNKVAAVIKRSKWRESPLATRWVGRAVAEALNLNAEDKADKAAITAMLKIWLAEGSLVVITSRDENRELRKFVVVMRADGN